MKAILMLIFGTVLVALAAAGVLMLSIGETASLNMPYEQNCDDCIRYDTVRFKADGSVTIEEHERDAYYAMTDKLGGVDCVLNFEEWDEYRDNTVYIGDDVGSCSQLMPGQACQQMEIENIEGKDVAYKAGKRWYLNMPRQHPSCQAQIAEFAESAGIDVNDPDETIYVCPDGQEQFSVDDCGGVAVVKPSILGQIGDFFAGLWARVFG